MLTNLNAAVNSEAVLREEANAIHTGKPAPDSSGIDDIPDHVEGKALYNELHSRSSTALCLSGGGIRSASFALGVIEALAVHPRPNVDARTPSELTSLLRQFDYLSTVSGGGYIGSWLSAWIARSGFSTVWSTLVGRRNHPDEEPGEIAWLRAYSNYLTPKVGLFSVDTWVSVALHTRNLILNWLVILPALCLFLFAFKLGVIGAFWLSSPDEYYILNALGILGGVLMIWVLRFETMNRPTCNSPVDGDRFLSGEAPAGEDVQRDGRGVTRGADARRFVFFSLIPAMLASNWLSLYALTFNNTMIGEWPLWKTAGLGLECGAVLYLLAWLMALPFVRCKEKRGFVYWQRDGFAWTIAGAVYGALAGLGAHVFMHQDLSILIGNIDVPEQTQSVVIVSIYGLPWLITAQLTAEMVFVGLISGERNADTDREWFGRSAGWYAAVACFWLAANSLVLFGTIFSFGLLAQADLSQKTLAFIGTFLFGLLSKRFLEPGPDAQLRTISESLAGWLGLLMPFMAAIFLTWLILAMSATLDYLLFNQELMQTALLGAFPADPTNAVEVAKVGTWEENWKWLWIGVGVVSIVASVSWTHVNINQFSAHALYRNRLIRAYLGASNPQRRPNAFTGFDGRDNCRMADLWPAPEGAWRPFHVVNIALNVVASGRLAWQERKAEPFTVTPLHCGTAAFSGTTGSSLGYRRTNRYANGLTLGTALALSGARANPNKGYHSSPLVSLMLALFNVRLGWWLGNPGPPGEGSIQAAGPLIAITPFIYEIFGETTDTRRHVHLADGGQFESLGLYEMIRRRCRFIVVSDAGYDPNYSFEALGNAVGKIAVDFGIQISVNNLQALRKRSDDNTTIDAPYHAVGVINYKTEDNPNAEPGYILYVKPGYHGTKNARTAAYANTHPMFPHESVDDGDFSEAQFESYRSLGFEIMDSVLTEAAKNVETIRNAGKGELNSGRLCDLLKALDSKLIKEAEEGFGSV